ncbi:hypothetical protein LINPERHAP2_LOCUS44419 [Linum perenne]
MRAFVPSIYDRTVAIMLPRWLPNSMPQINVQIKRHSMQELPGTADGIAQWCEDISINIHSQGLDVDASVGVPETDRAVLAAAEAVVSVGVQPRG